MYSGSLVDAEVMGNAGVEQTRLVSILFHSNVFFFFLHSNGNTSQKNRAEADTDAFRSGMPLVLVGCMLFFAKFFGLQAM